MLSNAATLYLRDAYLQRSKGESERPVIDDRAKIPKREGTEKWGRHCKSVVTQARIVFYASLCYTLIYIEKALMACQT